jgi:hypothetical protein
MHTRFSFFCVLITLLSASLSAQVIPPPGHNGDWALGYEQGFGDGSTAATQPAVPTWPADLKFNPDRTYYVSPDGNDRIADGSQPRPFATFDRAQHQVHWDREHGHGPKLAEIAYRANGTYAQAAGIGESHLLIDAYGAANPEQRPTITSTGYAFLGLQSHDVHLQNLRIIADPVAGGQQGVYINGGDDISLDYCEVDGFKTFDLCLIGGATHVRLHHNFIGDAFDPSKNTMSCSGLYTELVSPDVECNIFYHNGWKAPFDLTDGAWIQAMVFRHGWYENPGSGAVGGTDRFNLYLRNATTGHQCRTAPASVLWSVFWDNGNAADVFTSPGPSHTGIGEIGHCAFFGNATKDFACWGGGVVGQSVADNLHDLLFASPATSMGIQPAITIAWTGNANDNFPMPANITASVTNCRGIWPTADVSLQQGRKATATNVNIRKPNPGEHVPALTDFFGAADDQAIAQILRQNLHNAKYSAQAIIDWTGRSLPGN